VPGRGLRGAKFSELARRGPDATATWAVAAQLSGAEGTFEIGTGTAENAPDRRVFMLDGAKPRSQSEVAERLAAVWLTPQMDQMCIRDSRWTIPTCRRWC